MTSDIHDPRENGRLSPEALLPEQQRWLPFWLFTPLCSTCRLHGERDESQGDKDEEGRNKLSGFWNESSFFPPPFVPSPFPRPLPFQMLDGLI